MGFERTLGTTQLRERTVTFTGLVQHNENSRELGYRVAELLQLHKINYNFALPGVAGEADVDKAIEENIRTYGGLEYEAGPEDKKTEVDGSIAQFHFLSDDADDEDSFPKGGEQFDDTNSPSGSFDATGAADPNPSTSSSTSSTTTSTT